MSEPIHFIDLRESKLFDSNFNRVCNFVRRYGHVAFMVPKELLNCYQN
jgi:hypothetical protein